MVLGVVRLVTVGFAACMASALDETRDRCNHGLGVSTLALPRVCCVELLCPARLHRLDYSDLCAEHHRYTRLCD